MKRYAIDVVILPPESVTDLAIAWNARLSEVETQSIILDKTHTLPHISLLMGCIDEHGLKVARERLARLVENQPALPLHIPGLQFTEDSRPVAALDIALSEPIARFQNQLIETLLPVITRDTRDTDLFDPPPISASV